LRIRGHLSESFLRKIICALALCICGPALAQEASVPSQQAVSRKVDGNAVAYEALLDARTYVSFPIDRAGTIRIEGLTETFDGIHCADPDPARHAWGWTFDKFKALFEADGGYVSRGNPVRIADGFVPATRGILTAVLIDAGKYGPGSPAIPGPNTVEMTRAKWLEFRRIANSTPGITVAAVGKGGTLSFTGSSGYLVLFMNDRADAYTIHQGAVCVRAIVSP
jgi:hypothetical protein